MNQANFDLTSGFISQMYSNQAQQARRTREKMIQTLLSQRRLPQQGWDDVTIRLFLSELAAMDSNNFVDNVGVGEREARIYSNLVRERHFGFGHGIGRSGDVASLQPKAAGSSLIMSLVNFLVLDSLHIAGLKDIKECVVLPLATGMSITLTLLTLKKRNPKAKYVLWPRIDQKTCLKAIYTAGLQCIVADNILDGDEVRTDLKRLEDLMAQYNEEILCVISTSSCFAPRSPDKIIEISMLCEKHSIGHVINNAYGIQSSSTCNLISKASKKGRIDFVVSSTDKNYMVPVGGAIISSFKIGTVSDISKNYPGRACMAPILDIFITLLSMGALGFKNLLEEREILFCYFREKLNKIAEILGERILITPNNPISLGITLNSFDNSKGPTFLGSMLFSRCCSGVRTVSSTSQSIECHSFLNYGAHIDYYPCAYLTAAAAIGISKKDIDNFCLRLEKTAYQFQKSAEKS